MGGPFEDVEDVSIGIATKVEETFDDFIFKTTLSYLEGQKELENIVVSKKILCRALQCFYGEHRDEYLALLDELAKRQEERESEKNDRT